LDLIECTVIKNLHIAGDLYHLFIVKTSEFLSGQVIGLTVDTALHPRLYSIASGEKDNFVSILYTVQHTGSLTPRLTKLKTGDRVFTTAPTGNFKPISGKAWWIAGGTGIAPFISMVKSGYAQHKTLIHSSSRLDYFYNSSEFMNIENFEYIRCCSQESADGIFKGRATIFIDQHRNLPENTPFSICGNTGFVVAMRDILISRGIPFHLIHSEIYF
jgi:ferredoxin--NADP+ reductase